MQTQILRVKWQESLQKLHGTTKEYNKKKTEKSVVKKSKDKLDSWTPFAPTNMPAEQENYSCLRVYM